ncbi:hypothetical protein FB570_11751 [Streptomyces sp. T12]|nr:hypothetical protein FB570_11751 [Streptomyces sp. T12]
MTAWPPDVFPGTSRSLRGPWRRHRDRGSFQDSGIAIGSPAPHAGTAGAPGAPRRSTRPRGRSTGRSERLPRRGRHSCRRPPRPFRLRGLRCLRHTLWPGPAGRRSIADAGRGGCRIGDLDTARQPGGVFCRTRLAGSASHRLLGRSSASGVPPSCVESARSPVPRLRPGSDRRSVPGEILTMVAGPADCDGRLDCSDHRQPCLLRDRMCVIRPPTACGGRTGPLGRAAACPGLAPSSRRNPGCGPRRCHCDCGLWCECRRYWTPVLGHDHVGCRTRGV